MLRVQRDGSPRPFLLQAERCLKAILKTANVFTSVSETMNRSAVDNFVDVNSSKLNRLQQASITRPYLLEYKSLIFLRKFAFFDFLLNLPSKQGVAGSSPAGRTLFSSSYGLLFYTQKSTVDNFVDGFSSVVFPDVYSSDILCGYLR